MFPRLDYDVADTHVCVVIHTLRVRLEVCISTKKSATLIIQKNWLCFVHRQCADGSVCGTCEHLMDRLWRICVGKLHVHQASRMASKCANLLNKNHVDQQYNPFLELGHVSMQEALRSKHAYGVSAFYTPITSLSFDYRTLDSIRLGPFASH